MPSVSLREDPRSLRDLRGRPAVMHVGRGQQSERRVMMLVVVPLEQVAAQRPRAAASTAAQAWAVFLAFGLVAGLTESPERKLVAGYAGSARRGRGFGWYHGSLSAVALPGAALFGWLYQSRGAGTAFTLSAAATVAAVLLLGLSSSGWGRTRLSS